MLLFSTLTVIILLRRDDDFHMSLCAKPFSYFRVCSCKMSDDQNNSSDSDCNEQDLFHAELSTMTNGIQNMPSGTVTVNHSIYDDLEDVCSAQYFDNV